VEVQSKYGSNETKTNKQERTKSEREREEAVKKERERKQLDILREEGLMDVAS
jgi:hypothetical protein